MRCCHSLLIFRTSLDVVRVKSTTEFISRVLSTNLQCKLHQELYSALTNKPIIMSWCSINIDSGRYLTVGVNSEHEDGGEAPNMGSGRAYDQQVRGQP